jgi:hypothetical protein
MLRTYNAMFWAVLYSPSPRDGKQPLVGLTPQKPRLSEKTFQLLLVIDSDRSRSKGS